MASVTEFNVVKALRPLRRRHPWLVPGMVFVGLLAALFEGVGLSLFLPLLYSLDAASFSPTNDGVLGQALHRAFSRVPESDRLLAVSLGIMVLVSLKNLLIYLNSVLNSWIRTLLVHSLRAGIVDELLLARVDYVEGQEAGRLLNAVQKQTQEAGEAVAQHAELLIRAGTAAVFAVLLLLISWKLTLGVGAALLVISLLVRQIWRRVESHSGEFVRAWDRLSQRCLELLSGMRTIQVFDRVDFERDRFGSASHEVGRVWFHLDLLSGLVRPVSEVLVVGVLVVVLLTTLQDASNMPTVLTFAFILYRLRPQVQGIDVARAQLLAAKAPVETVMALLDPADKPRLASGTRAFSGLVEGLRFEGVCFRHPTADEDALHDVCLSIPAGRITALIGRSGAGKSTLLQLVLRLTDPDRGRVLVDGVPLPEFELHSWRRRAALVTQDPMLFNTTVWQNIQYGHPEADREQVLHAADLAGVGEFVSSLPLGYESVVGDQGVRLSGGQKQRIALARALVRNPEILVLDEATSALDAQNEALVLDAISGPDERRTVVVVSHRYSAVERADHFVLLERGRATSEGGRAVLDQHGRDRSGLRGSADGGDAGRVVGRAGGR